MNNNKLVLFIVLVALILIVKNSPFNLGLFSISIPDLENQLRQEYTTYWDDVTDENLACCPASCTLKDNDYEHKITDKLREEVKAGIINEGCVNVYSNGVETVYYKDISTNINSRDYRYKLYFTKKFDCVFSGDTGGIGTGDGHFTINPAGVGSASCVSTQKWKGQEVTYIVGGTYHTPCSFVSGGYQCDPYVHYTFKPHTLDSDTYDVYINGQLSRTQVSPNGIEWGSGARSSRSSDFGATASGTTYFIGYKSQFECDLSENERWIETQWINNVNINDVIQKDGLIPTKFCKTTRPFVLRDIQQGETAINPDPIPAFNRGQTLTSPSQNQLIIVRYAVYQVPGLEQPTTGTQAYVCDQRDSNYKCLHWSVKEVIKPIEIVVQCQQDTDCPLPLTDFLNKECLGYFKGCQQNKCVYDNTILNAPKCQNQVVTIIKQIEVVDNRTIIPVSGSNSFIFSQNSDRTSFNIGDKTFTANPAEYLCELPDASSISPPKPSSDCWQTQMTYGGKSFSIKDSQKQTIYSLGQTPLIDVQYFASGKLTIINTTKKYKRPTDWSNNFIFTINTDEALKLDVEDSSFVLKDSNKKIKLFLSNNLPDGNFLIKVHQKVRTTNQNLPLQSTAKLLGQGLNVFEVDMNTQNLGINTITIQLFYKINANTEVLIPSDKFIINYDVVTQMPTSQKVVIVTQEEETSLAQQKPSKPTVVDASKGFLSSENNLNFAIIIIIIFISFKIISKLRNR